MTKSIAEYWDVVEMGEETIKKVLKNSGLTKSEAEIYIFLAKHQALKTTEIAKLTRKDRAQVFRILQSLQTKGFVEATLEFPAQYTTVPFENVLESILKAKKEEVVFIEKTKEDLLSYLREKRQSKSSLEKFVVIKGDRRIFSKITQMIRNTEHQLSAVATVPSLMRADRFDVFDSALEHTKNSPTTYRFLTDLSEKNLSSMKSILKRASRINLNFKARNPELGLKLFPRMIIRDNEEILFFTSPETQKVGKDDKCLWTNCNTLVQTFTSVFEDLWQNSTDLDTKFEEIETHKKTSTTLATKTAKDKYEEILGAAKKEIIMMTSSRNLIDFWLSEPPFKKWAKRCVSVKIMAPITRENLGVVESLSKFCEIRHVAAGQLSTTVVDDRYLFQFSTESAEKERLEDISSFRNSFYSENSEYVGKVGFMLDDFWRNARVPSTATLESILQSSSPFATAFDEDSYTVSRLDSPYRKMVVSVEEKPRMVTEEEVLSKINNARRHPVKSPLDTVVFYGRHASAVIRPPSYLNLPEM
ncbi:MAG: helix-turn-helix domain-containing protein, partial [Candidatus Hodarchaeota archaeon]